MPYGLADTRGGPIDITTMRDPGTKIASRENEGYGHGCGIKMTNI